MSTPSLLNIPYLYKAGTLYSQIPESGAGDFTVSRTTTVANRSTRINKDGFIETVLDNVPRLDYPLGGAVNGCPALLVEPAATNLLLRSEDFNDAYWNKTQQGTGLIPVVTPNNAISPDGNQTADLVVFNRGAGNSSNDRSILSSTSTIVSGSQYNGSVWVKAATPSDVGKQIAFRHVAQATHLVITLTANWVRYNQTESSVLTAGDWRLVNIGTVTADNVVGVHVWGAQLELGSVPTSYIPTTTAAVTRSADVITNTAASALIGQSEGTIYAEIDTRNLYQGIGVFSIRSSTTNYVMIYMSSAARRFAGLISAAGASFTVGQTANGLSPGIYKMALAYKANDCAFYVNGVLVGSTSQATPTGMTEVSIAQDATSPTSRNFNDRIRALALYPNRIPNTAAAGVLSLATLTAL